MDDDVGAVASHRLGTIELCCFASPLGSPSKIKAVSVNLLHREVWGFQSRVVRSMDTVIAALLGAFFFSSTR